MTIFPAVGKFGCFHLTLGNEGMKDQGLGILLAPEAPLDPADKKLEEGRGGLTLNMEASQCEAFSRPLLVEETFP